MLPKRLIVLLMSLCTLCGACLLYTSRTVVEDGAVEDPNAQIAVSEVKAIDPTYEIGDEYADEIKLSSFGRRTVLSLRQNLASRILDLEKEIGRAHV